MEHADNHQPLLDAPPLSLIKPIPESVTWAETPYDSRLTRSPKHDVADWLLGGLRHEDSFAA